MAEIINLPQYYANLKWSSYPDISDDLYFNLSLSAGLIKEDSQH